MHDRLIIIGGTGDLSIRYLLPAAARLLQAGKLSPGFRVDAVARDEFSTEGFRQMLREALGRLPEGTAVEARERLIRSVTYHRADATDSLALGRILSRETQPSVVYLALPPLVFRPSVKALLDAGLENGHRLVIEKPHGTGLDDTRALNRLLSERLPEDSVFRIDHFLGHQTVQNLLGIRFGNRIFEPLWNCSHVESVEIRFDETLALEGRAEYYDRTGALRDMLQNHLLQLLCLAAMEPPLHFSARDFRDKKVEVLRAVRTLSEDDIPDNSIRARYTAGSMDGRSILSYTGEHGVDPERKTETFAQLRLRIDTWRWAGTPFILRSGKALAANRQEIVIRFRDVPYRIFGKNGSGRPNELRLLFEPDRMSLRLNLNGENDPFELEPACLDLVLAPQELPAYARLLLDIMEGDPILAIRSDEAEESWRIVEPVVAAWREGRVALREYPAGSEFEPRFPEDL